LVALLAHGSGCVDDAHHYPVSGLVSGEWGFFALPGADIIVGGGL